MDDRWVIIVDAAIHVFGALQFDSLRFVHLLFMFSALSALHCIEKLVDCRHIRGFMRLTGRNICLVANVRPIQDNILLGAMQNADS